MSVAPPVSRAVPNFRYSKDAVNHPNFHAGDFTYGIPTVRWILGDEKVIFGKYCSISPQVEILMSGNHPVDTVSTYPFPALKDVWPGALGQCPTARGDVIVGNDVWIGYGATLLSGVTIGDGAVIGAQAVVAKSVPPYAVAVGNPARVVRYRFDEETIALLQKIRWWDWPEEKVRRHIAVITGKDIHKIAECE